MIRVGHGLSTWISRFAIAAQRQRDCGVKAVRLRRGGNAVAARRQTVESDTVMTHPHESLESPV